MNAQVFAYTQSFEFGALLEVECKESTGLRPVIHGSVEELKSILDILHSVDVLVIDLPEDLSVSLDLKEFLLNCMNRTKKIFVLGNESGINGNIRLFSRSEVADLINDLKAFFVTEEIPQTGWTEIPLCTLVHFTALPFDLFIKLSDNRYVKRFPAFEDVGRNLVDALKAKGVEELYCEKKHGRDFSMLLINNLINQVDREYPSLSEELTAHNQVFETTQKIIQELGVSSRVVEVCEAGFEKMYEKVMKGPSEFNKYLQALTSEKNLAFGFKFINLTNYIGVQLILDMKMPEEEEQIKKFIFSSYFCDMTLKNHNLIFYRKAEDGSGDLTLDDQNALNFHALRASELVSTYKGAPPDAAVIVRQHHGSPTGIGFPVDKTHLLLPLSKILIISQDLAFAILTNEKIPARHVLLNFVEKNRYPGLMALLTVMEGYSKEFA